MPRPNEPSSKRQRTASDKKCGYCRVPGHTVRHCIEPGIHEFRARKERSRNAGKLPAPMPDTPLSKPSAPMPITSFSKLLKLHLPAAVWKKLYTTVDVPLLESDLDTVWRALPFYLSDPVLVLHPDEDVEITAVFAQHPRCQLSGQPLARPVLGDYCTHTGQLIDLASLLMRWRDLLRAEPLPANWDKCPLCKLPFKPGLLHRSKEVEAGLEKHQSPPDNREIICVD